MTQLESQLDTCPTAPATRVTVHTRVLHRACQKLGGVDQLAQFLNVPLPTVYRWLEGESTPPMSIFLKTVDIVMPEWGPEDDALARALLAGRAKQPARN
jgi:hypothetical protein